MNSLDSPLRMNELQSVIHSKPALKKFYHEVYQKFSECLKRCPREGGVIELGSGASFAKELIPELTTSDLLPYPGIDQVVDATKMPFKDQSLRAIFMLNVFHHISDVEAFLKEANRCLVPGGRILLVDQHLGWISRRVLKHLHHEPFNPAAESWKFETSGPLSGANGALTWIVFQRDRARYEALFPQLRIEQYTPHTPLRYWLCGGLKTWSLIPGWAFTFFTSLDRFLIRRSPQLGSFVDVELVKT